MSYVENLYWRLRLAFAISQELIAEMRLADDAGLDIETITRDWTERTRSMALDWLRNTYGKRPAAQ